MNDGHRQKGRIPRNRVPTVAVSARSATRGRSHASSTATFVARLGCTFIGSPGIFGEREAWALSIAA